MHGYNASGEELRNAFATDPDCQTLLVVLLSTTFAYTAPITFKFTGQLTYAAEPPGLFGDVITPSSTLTGSYTFERAAPDMNPVSGGGEYEASGPPYGIRVNISGVEFASPGLTIRLVDNFFGFDQFGPSYGSAFAGPAGTTINNLALSFTDHTQTALSGDALPLFPPPFEESQFSIYGHSQDGAEFSYNGALTSLTLATEVPEPTTRVVTGAVIGLGLLVYRMRRSRAAD